MMKHAGAWPDGCKNLPRSFLASRRCFPSSVVRFSFCSLRPVGALNDVARCRHGMSESAHRMLGAPLPVEIAFRRPAQQVSIPGGDEAWIAQIAHISADQDRHPRGP